MRAERSDKGQIRVTERDLQVFTWLADMKAIYETDLRILLGRMAGGAAPSESAVRQVVNRWQKADLAKAQKMLANRPRIVMLRPNGAGLVAEPNWKETAMWTAYHQAEVSHCRLWLEGRSGDDPEMKSGAVAEWEPERRIRQRAWEKFRDGTKGMHIADGLVTFANGTRAAIEVELTEKGSSRLRDIVERLTTANELTIYLAKDPARRRQIAAAYEHVKANVTTLRTMPLVVWDYPERLES